MVLQVGAVRHKLPDELDEDRDALRGVEQAGRTALAEMRRLLGAMRRDGDEPRARAPARPRRPRLAAGGGRPRRASRPAARRRRAVPAPARDRPLGLSNRPGGPDQRAQARPRQPRGRDRPLRATTSSSIEVVDDGDGRRDERRPRPRPRRHPRARQDLRRRDDRRHRRRKAASSSAPAFRSTATGHEHPRPRRRRPVDGPRRLPHAALAASPTSRSSPRRATGSRRSTRRRASTRPSS